MNSFAKYNSLMNSFSILSAKESDQIANFSNCVLNGESRAHYKSSFFTNFKAIF